MGVQQSDVDDIVKHMLGGEPVTDSPNGWTPGLRDLILEILESE